MPWPTTGHPDHVHAAVGEPPLVTQTDDLEPEVLGRITAGDEMHRQRTGRQAGGDRSAARDQRLGHHLTAEGPNRILGRMRTEESVLVGPPEVQVTSSSAKSEAAGNMSPLVVVLPDPVHMDQAGRAYCARRSARDDDHQSPACSGSSAEFAVRPPDHLVRRLHSVHDEGLGSPGERQLDRTSGSAVNANSGSRVCNRASRRSVAGLGEGHRALASSRSPISPGGGG